MSATAVARPELLGLPRLPGRGILHHHLIAASLTANLHTCSSHVAIVLQVRPGEDVSLARIR